MKGRSKAIVILTILFGYVLLQFIWWEILLVKQTGTIIHERQKLAEISISDENRLRSEINALHHRKTMQTVMIVSEGTVFLLLLLFGLYKIKQAQDREVALTTRQNNFLLSVTHELKTPVAATKLQLQTLQKRKLPVEMQEKLLENAIQENERLNALIDNVLLASRIGSGEMHFKKEKQNLPELSRNIINRYFSEQLREGRVQFKTEEEPLYCLTDTEAFTSILSNLVANALKYSDAHTAVEIALKREKNKILLSITDSGTGIRENEKKQVFGMFYRSGNENTRSTKGTGLGLYIVENLVRNHNGSIEIKDNMPQGTKFEVRFNGA